MITWEMMKTWPYHYLIDVKGYTLKEAILKIIIWPFAFFFFVLTMGMLGSIMVINTIFRTWVVYPKALAQVSSQVFTPRASSLLGWLGKLLSLVLLIVYGSFIFIEKACRRGPLGVLRFLDLKES